MSPRGIRKILVPLVPVILALTLHGSAGAAGTWDQYRFPFQYGTTWYMTQGWNGATSHTTANQLYYAIDLAPPSGANQSVFSADEGYATCVLDQSNGFGYYVRVTHGTNSSMYAHLTGCGGFTAQNVVQGYQIGTAGCTGSCTGTHVHFQVNTTTTSTYAASFSVISSISGSTFNNGGNNCPAGYTCSGTSYPTYTSDNEAAGYDTGLNYYPVIKSGYVNNGGWSVVGSSSGSSVWAPCGLSTPAVYGCTENGRSGLVQTFIGAGTYQGRHAILQANGAGTAYFMSRGLLGGYTDRWDGVHDGLWFQGYPTSNSYSIGGSTYRMNFQNGYATYNASTCASAFYYGPSNTLGHTATYCD